MKSLKSFLMLCLVSVAFLALTDCADSTSPFSGEGEDNSQYYFGFGKSYKSTIEDLESRRLSANIQRKVSHSDIQALRGGRTILLVGNVATKVDIETVRAIALVEYTDDQIINKLISESVRRDEQLSEDNDITDKVAALIEKQQLFEIRFSCFKNNIYLLLPKVTDTKKLDPLLKSLKAIPKVKDIQQFTY